MPDPQEITGDAPIALYRLYDAAGALLYVGVTHSLSERFAQHAAEKPWWPEVAHRTAAWYHDRRQALAAEAEAIAGEGPRYNITGVPRPAAPRGRGREADRHRHHPITFRPSPGLRARLDAYTAASGQAVRRVLALAVEAYLDEHAPEPEQVPV